MGMPILLETIEKNNNFQNIEDYFQTIPKALLLGSENDPHIF